MHPRGLPRPPMIPPAVRRPMCWGCECASAFISPSFPLSRPCVRPLVSLPTRSHFVRPRRVYPRRVWRICAAAAEIPDEDGEKDGKQPEGEQPKEVPLDMDLLRRRMLEVDLNDSKSKQSGRASKGALSVTKMSSEGMDEREAEIFEQAFDKLKTLWVIMFTNVEDGSDGVYSLTVSDDNIVLAFEQREEAQRYAMCLEAQDFPRPQVCELESSELQTFCLEAGLRLGFVPSGALISPPEESAVDNLDSWRGEPNSSRGGKDSSGLSEDDLDTMRKRLDSLFGK